MSAPNAAFARFVTGLLLGCVLGIVYGFLRPLRQKRTAIADLLFCVFAGWTYLYYGFAVCRGDLRAGYLLPPLLSAIGWDRTVGRRLIPLFAYFWHFMGILTRPVKLFLKKNKQICKIFLCKL